MNHRAIAASIISLGLLAVPAPAAHAVLEPAPGGVAAGTNDLAPQDPGSDALDQPSVLDGICAPPSQPEDSARYRTTFDISNQAARNRSEIANLR